LSFHQEDCRVCQTVEPLTFSHHLVVPQLFTTSRAAGDHEMKNEGKAQNAGEAHCSSEKDPRTSKIVIFEET